MKFLTLNVDFDGPNSIF